MCGNEQVRLEFVDDFTSVSTPESLPYAEVDRIRDEVHVTIAIQRVYASDVLTVRRNIMA